WAPLARRLPALAGRQGGSAGGSARTGAARGLAPRAGADLVRDPGRPVADRRSGERVREPLRALGSRGPPRERRPGRRARAPRRSAVAEADREMDGAAPSQPSGDRGADDTGWSQAPRGAGGPRRRSRVGPDRTAPGHFAEQRGRALLGRPVRRDVEIAGDG